jgi:alkaline phosphatase D
MNRLIATIAIILISAGCSSVSSHEISSDGPYQATGIKIGEVTSDSAIIWTRLTASPKRIGNEGGLPTILYLDPKSGKPKKIKGRPSLKPVVKLPSGGIDSLEGAVPGTLGESRILYRATGQTVWQETDWMQVDQGRDFTCQTKLSNLHSGMKYEIRVEARSGEQYGQVIAGSFRTAPAPLQASRVVFTVTTGQRYGEQETPQGYKMYPEMLKLTPDFFVHTGDIIYYDNEAKTIPLAKWHWQRMYSLPSTIDFHRQVASYFMKDDHDTWMNDCWPSMETLFMGEFTFENGKEIFLEQVPMDKRTWRTVRWGKDLQIWMVEGRDFRSPNTMKDGPQKTIWGKEQMAWFRKTFNESDATYRILISPTPIVGPDRFSKKDNHANSGFQHEGQIIRKYIAEQKNAFVICGDRHWQYVSKDLKTGLQEFSCGPVTDEHAGGFSEKNRNAMHQYLNIKGGFLSVEVDRAGGHANIIFRHHGVDGQIYNTVQHQVRSE